VSWVYVKGDNVYRIPRKIVTSFLTRLRQIWSGREIPAGEICLFSNSWLGALMRFYARNFSCSGFARSDNAYYINVSQRNLANRAVVEMVERDVRGAIFVIHDLLPITYRHFFDENAAVMHQAKLCAAMKMRGIMVCGSQTLEKELRELAQRYVFGEIKVVLSKFGCKRPSRLTTGLLVPRREPYHVMIATFEPRKNHRFLLEVWKEMIRRAGSFSIPNLVMIGRRGSESHSIERMLDANVKLTGKVQLIEGADDLEASDLIANAEAVLIPSVAEGYGLPLYEAFSHGVPVIASDLPVFRELAGSTAQLLPVNDIEAWVASIIDHDMSGERMRQRKLLRLWQRPTWANHFRQVLAALESQA
jgi:glycosyltransferase involved in cell wall biosynthesis